LESEIEPLSDAEVDWLIRPELLRLALTDAETLSEVFRESERLPDLLELSLWIEALTELLAERD
jgi:hypothetical protein